MDFFTSQEASRRRTRRLLMVFALACALIMVAVVAVVAALFAVADGTLEWLLTDPTDWLRVNTSLVIATAVITLAVIGLSSAYRSAKLSSGGGDIARSLGGTEIAHDTTDPLRLRLRNVVEEMAIASGVPVPETFVLESEGGINAFAAGFAPGDAAIAVTRGCLEQLDREELQGVVAHEFSHILNGDMRLNIRLMGILFGILVIGMLGRMLLHGGRLGTMRMRTGRRGGNGGGGAALVLIGGLALVVIGSIGVLFGRLIRAGVSRQREFLADASAVQFTRSNRGIAGALKKIGGLDEGSHLTATNTEEVGHMLFARGNRAFRNLFATHPPLEQRLAALGVSVAADPGAAARQASAAMGDDTRISGFAAGAVSAQVGQFDAEHVAYAEALRERLPAALADAAHSRDSAPLLVLALLMHGTVAVRARQLSMLAGQLGEVRCRRVESLASLVAEQGRAMRLPLLDIAFVSFKERPEGELRFYQALARRLADASGEVELFEYCLLKLMELYLDQARTPARADSRVGARAGRLAVAELLLIIAQQGGDGKAARQAYRAGTVAYSEALGQTVEFPDFAPVSDWQPRLDAALQAAAGLPAAIRRAAVTALACVITHNDHVSVSELELLRVVCAALECPLPPQLPRAGDEQVT